MDADEFCTGAGIWRRLKSLPGHRRPRRREAGGLLKSVGQLEDAEVVPVAADDLDADGQAFGRESARDRDRGMAGFDSRRIAF